MTLRKPLSIVLGSAALVLVVAACDKKSDAGATGAASAAPAASGPAITYSKKPPSKAGHTVTQQAKKGGSGDTRPSASSAKTSEAATDRQMRKASTVDKVDCTGAGMDNAAECDGDKLYFCDDKQLYYVDCNEESKFAGLAGGSCFEGEKFIDCLGCDKADDGSTACCDFQLSVCCDEAGNCYSPKG